MAPESPAREPFEVGGQAVEHSEDGGGLLGREVGERLGSDPPAQPLNVLADRLCQWCLVRLVRASLSHWITFRSEKRCGTSRIKRA